MRTTAVILQGPKELGLESLGLTPPGPEDLVVDIAWSGISTGTEKLFWSGTMPPFPGMGYPLVPGYEAAGEVVEAGPATGFRVGEHVFVLAGFYTEPVAFAFAPAFMKEARIRIAAEWTPEDLTATRSLIDSGTLSLDGLITHRRPASEAKDAYRTAFEDADCLKMILDWSGHA